jgi:hypothetical protein
MTVHCTLMIDPPPSPTGTGFYVVSAEAVRPRQGVDAE